MLNTTKGEVAFKQTGVELTSSILRALDTAARWVLMSSDLEGLPLSTVTTRTNPEAAFPAYLETHISLHDTASLNEQYVIDALNFTCGEQDDEGRALYKRLTRAPEDGPRAFRKTFVAPLKRGFGAFLIALHASGVITLPFTFRWPMGFRLGKGGLILGRREICNMAELPELLQFFRRLESQSTEQSDPIFASLTVKQRERLAWIGAKIVMVLGWLEPEDANYEDLLKLKEANDATCFTGQENIAAQMICDVLQKKYGARCAVNAAGWQAALEEVRREEEGSPRALKSNTDMDVVLAQALELSSAEMTPEGIEGIEQLPGISFSPKRDAGSWTTLQKSYLKKVKRESNKHRLLALGYLNAYLYGYLPYWYNNNPGFEHSYPSVPNELIAAVFVSDLGLFNAPIKPVTLIEFLGYAAEKRQWGSTTLYGAIKQIEKFFDFIARAGAHTPGCENFSQPIGESDYPSVARSRGTNKRPIPRRVFKYYLQYIEALCAHSEVLYDRILSGELDELGFLEGLGHTTTVIDTFRIAEIVGFVPLIYGKRGIVPLRFIPNVLYMGEKSIKGGRVLRIPHPHGLYQILVSLYTGIRQQHIQWLDAQSFDKFAPDDADGREFAELFVNTDKAKNLPWKPFVNYRVIEILRRQLRWRNAIAEPNFTNLHYYNQNPDTKWDRILPLFSYYDDGSPHEDQIYATTWSRILAGVQGILPELGEPDVRLMRLLPRGIGPEDHNIAEALYEYGINQERRCDVVIKSTITPHSARVSVVSHSITVLPADLIGKYLTGQSQATVHHYVVLDDDEIFAEQQIQNMKVRDIGYASGYQAMLAAVPGAKSPYIAADSPDSNLSVSLRTDFDNALDAYGCISISMQADQKTGMDILRETQAVGAASNKTEICPFGNHCPKEVVLALGTFKRCGPCHYAVRSVDHLPAITAKMRQVMEQLADLDSLLTEDDVCSRFTATELDEAAKQRDRLAEDLAAWQMAAEVLELMRARLAEGKSTKIWHIQKPEIIERHLRRIRFPSDTTQYVLARLVESEAFPMLESPQIRSRFELLKRKLLVNVGNIQAALSLEPSVNPGAECLGMIRSIMGAHRLTVDDIIDVLNGPLQPVAINRARPLGLVQGVIDE